MKEAVSLANKRRYNPGIHVAFMPTNGVFGEFSVVLMHGNELIETGLIGKDMDQLKIKAERARVAATDAFRLQHNLTDPERFDV